MRNFRAVASAGSEITGGGGGGGSTVLNGSGAPSGGTGSDGDFYIDTAADTIYGPKSGGAWGSATSLVGPAGADGSDGATGAQGPQGDTGATGAQGPQGDTGATGATGPAGSDGADGQGVPAGGTAGQVLEKIDGTDFNTQWATPAGGGGGATPAEELVFNGTLSSASLNTNASGGTAMTWNDSVEHADITHTDGDSVVIFDVAGEYIVDFSIEVTNGAANNRQTWTIDLLHQDSTPTEIFTYSPGSASYIRDDASTYDSGQVATQWSRVVAADDRITISSRRLDAQTTAGVNNADQTASYLRIYRKTYS